MFILVDDEDRENEGDLTVAAEKVTPEIINFMATHGRGLICLSLEPKIVDQLKLPMMTDNNKSPFGTGFTVSIEAKVGVSTGISAFDRATTILAAVADGATPDDLVTPGHIFPLRAREGGVLDRAGQTEGSVDLARLAGLGAAAVMARVAPPTAEAHAAAGAGAEAGEAAADGTWPVLARRLGVPLLTVQGVLAHRRRTEAFVQRRSTASLPTVHGTFTAHGYLDTVTGIEHVALVVGDPSGSEAPLVRLHSECLTGEVFGSLRCDCGPQLEAAMAETKTWARAPPRKATVAPAKSMNSFSPARRC